MPARKINPARCNDCGGLMFGGKCPAPACQKPFDGDVGIAYEVGYDVGYEDGYEEGFEDGLEGEKTHIWE